MRCYRDGLGRYSAALIGGLAVLGACCLGTGVRAGPLIINEYNAVGSGDYLDGGDYSDSVGKQDTYFASIEGMADGRIEGNGGNWIELVVVEDRIDIRGWSLRWAETDVNDTDGSDLWFGDDSVEQGILTFSPTADIWSDLRAGTIITISEKDAIGVDTTWDGSGTDRNFTKNILPAEVDVTIDLSTDTSYDPAGGDWWIHVSTRGEVLETNPLITTLTNVDDDVAGDFSIGPDKWEVSVFDDLDTLRYGPIGEGITDFGDFPGGLGDKEAGRLEADPAVGLDNDSYDDVTSTTFGGPNEWGGTEQDFSQLRALVPEPGTPILLAAAGGILAFFASRRRKRIA